MEELSKIEQRANLATKLAAFPINLYEIRSQLKLLLGEVQRYGFFNEYTNHNFEHVQSMLEMAEWIIPDQAKDKLQPADYLLLTLSIYFHDLGLLISQNEFNNRGKNTAYQRYIREQSENTQDQDYNAKLLSLSPEMRERINYQEFVRFTHGTRVKEWILGKDRSDETSAEIKEAIQELVGKLDIVIRRDLALLCESHTIDDISDTHKYKVSMPYGNTAGETANLQYIAIILRTVDIFQITKGRAPSVLFKIINPQDPISQIEWQKQGAVRTVRSAPGIDRDGNASKNAISDTIEIHARFEVSDGFFGLTSYIAYAKSQLQACQEALKQSAKLLADPPIFPWKHIDESGIEAEGFLTRAFGFKLDQQKILDLLTGHTLYNDSDVVVRELTQNALDAVRLQSNIIKESSNSFGKIEIIWNSKVRTLEVRDNGTGMTQEVIEAHLLKVGSSRYQDAKFREEYPEFSSISRFGIGVLSAFMVADQVEITTCSTEENEARQISLRSVHGKYLIKLLDKTAARDEIGVYPHGSRVRLTLRPTAKIGDVLEIAKTWLVFPRCSVSVKIDNEDEVFVGYSSPKEAIEHQIRTQNLFRHPERIEVREVSEDGVTLAYAVFRDELYNDWNFILRDRHSRIDPEENRSFVGTCIEGVGVEFNSPGFRNPGIFAIANITGKSAPKTNVARSAIEDTPEYRDSLKKIYNLYTRHIDNEITRLSKTKEYSLSRAVEQAPYIAAPLTSEESDPIRQNLLDEELDKVPFILNEEAGLRTKISFKRLCEINSFWTTRSSLNSSVEFFVREASNDITASMILETLQDGLAELPEGALFCNFGNIPYLEKRIRKSFEPTFLHANEYARRLTMRWEKIDTEPRWINSRELLNQVALNDRRFYSLASIHRERRGIDARPSSFAVGEIEVENLDEYSDVYADKQIYFHPNDEIAILLKNTWQEKNIDSEKTVLSYLAILELLRSYGVSKEVITADTFERIIMNNNLEFTEEYIDIPALVEAIHLSKFKSFNPFAWRRRMGLEDN
ncbi:ATP-binding protein [Enterobacter asburiae]